MRLQERSRAPEKPLRKREPGKRESWNIADPSLPGQEIPRNSHQPGIPSPGKNLPWKSWEGVTKCSAFIQEELEKGKKGNRDRDTEQGAEFGRREGTGNEKGKQGGDREKRKDKEESLEEGRGEGAEFGSREGTGSKIWKLGGDWEQNWDTRSGQGTEFGSRERTGIREGTGNHFRSLQMDPPEGSRCPWMDQQWDFGSSRPSGSGSCCIPAPWPRSGALPERFLAALSHFQL